MTKTVTLRDFLTPAEIERAYQLYQTAALGNFARLCDEQIITPNLEAINRKLGQENSSRYLAYMIEYAFMKMEM